MVDVRRGTGRTSRQLMRGCKDLDKFIYVVPNRNSMKYYEELIKHLEIPADKVILKPIDFIENNQYRGLRTPIILDHAVIIDRNESEILWRLMVHNTRTSGYPKEVVLWWT